MDLFIRRLGNKDKKTRGGEKHGWTEEKRQQGTSKVKIKNGTRNTVCCNEKQWNFF
jgi:hypothetical protein